jgi:kynurenine formamidase
MLPPELGQSPPFKLHLISRFDERGPEWYWNWLEVSEHSGTHIDAPNHWITGKDKESVDQIPLERLVCPAAVIDVRDKVAGNPDYSVTVEDLENWEERHGELPGGAIVIMNSGWGQKVTDTKAYRGIDENGNSHYPGFSGELARWLIANRDINGVASDTPSTDTNAVAPNMDPPFPVHVAMHEAGKFQLEELANVDRLPPAGAYLIVAPMKIKGGSGAPARVLGVLP